MPTDAVVLSARSTPSGLDRALIPLVRRPEPFDDPEWIFEPRYDGFRAVLVSSAERCEIDGVPDAVPLLNELQVRVAEVLGGREAVLDGEVVALDRKGKPVLQHLLRGEGYLAFAAWDILLLDGVDLTGQPLRARKAQLAELLPLDTGPLYKVLGIEEHGRALFGAIRKLELGGIMAKRLTDPYQPSAVWYEIRNPAYSSASDAWTFRQPSRHGTPVHRR